MTNPCKTSKIYLTYKTRMVSEKRIRRAASLKRKLLTWYSLVLIAYSLLDISKIDTLPNFSISSVICTIALFGFSLASNEQTSFEQAEAYRQCYLKLQSLYNKDLHVDEKMKEYGEILSLYENQTDDDYDEMRFEAWFRGQELENTKGKLPLGWAVGTKVALKKIGRFLFYGFLFVLPICPPFIINK